MKGKRGVVATQFHWVFVLVAGVLVLSFFIMVIGAIKKTETTKLGVEMMEKLEGVMTSSSVNEDTVHVIETSGPVHLVFSCEYDREQDAIISSYGLRKPEILNSQNPVSVFAPHDVSGREFIIDVKQFGSPFRVDRVLFVSSPEIHFVFIGADVQWAASLFSTNVSVVSFDNFGQYLADRGTGARTQVLVTQETLESLTPSERSSLNSIARSSSLMLKQIKPEEHTVRFLKFTNGEFSSRGPPEMIYLDNTTLLGALYAEDSNYYRCVAQRLQQRFDAISYLYSRRYEGYMDRSSSVCGLHYQSSIDALNELQGMNNFFDPGNDPASKFEQYKRSVESFTIAARNVEEQSCPVLY